LLLQLSSPPRPKLSKFKDPMMDLKLSSVLSSPVEMVRNPLHADATSAHVVRLQLRNTVDTMPLMPLEKLSRRPPRISKEKLRRERTKRKPKLELRRLNKKPKNLRRSKSKLMRPRRSNMPLRKPSTNRRKFTPRKSKIKLSRKLENKLKKKLPKFLRIQTNLSKLKLLEMLLIKPLPKSKKELINLRKMPPPLKPLLIRLPLMPRLLEIRLPIPPKPPETRPMPLPNLLKRKPTVPRRRLRMPKIKLPQISVPHQRNEIIESEIKKTLVIIVFGTPI